MNERGKKLPPEALKQREKERLVCPLVSIRGVIHELTENAYDKTATIS